MLPRKIRTRVLQWRVIEAWGTARVGQGMSTFLAGLCPTRSVIGDLVGDSEGPPASRPTRWKRTNGMGNLRHSFRATSGPVIRSRIGNVRAINPKEPATPARMTKL